jgi:hypothetical protein
MADPLSSAVANLAIVVRRLRTPAAVLQALQDGVSRPQFSLDVLGVWQLPNYLSDPMWHIGENAFFHPDVDQNFWPDYQRNRAAHGYPASALRARQKLCAVHQRGS